jgi:hypothetical protein
MTGPPPAGSPPAGPPFAPSAAPPVTPPGGPPVPPQSGGRAGRRAAPATLPPRADPLTTTGSGRRLRDLAPPPPARPDLTGAGLDSRWPATRSKRWYAVLAAAGVLAVLVTCGAFSYQLVQEELAGRNAQADSGEPSATVPRDISSREVDPEPLTVKEVFPEKEIVINPDEPPYRVLTTDASKDCTVAAVDKLQALLGELDCSQVIRATFRSPTKDYLITGGVLNLATQAGAAQAYEDIKPLIEKGTGRFLGLLAGDGTESIVLSETVLFWDYRGHYLMYAVVARADGDEFSPADNRYADLVSWDIIEVHLRGTVLEARATRPNPAATGSPATGQSGGGAPGAGGSGG